MAGLCAWSRRRTVAATTLALLFVTAVLPASAQTDGAAGYPRQAIKIVVGFTPGGSNDLIARLAAQKLGERFGQPVIVENKPGANAIIGAEYVARAAPDGYTLLTAPAGTLSINPAVYAKLPYDALKSYDTIGIIGTYPFVMSVAADHPARTAKELIEWSRANPTKANYASTSAVFQLATELFKTKTGASFEHIPFKSGGEMVTAILTGQVTMAFADTGPLMAQVKAGKIRALATTGAKRLPELPDVPTMAEAGIPEIVVEGYSGLVAPKGTPPAILKKLEAEIVAMVQLPDVRERLSQLGILPSGETGAQFTARIEREIPMWTAVAKAAGIKLD